MCLAMPLEIKSIEGVNAIAGMDGIEQKIRVDLIKDPKPGDFVMVHAGFAIERLTKEQTEANMELLREIADATANRQG